MERLCLLLVVLSALVCIHFTEGVVNFTKIITTTSGPIRGKFETLPTDKTARKYLGIRYGKAERFVNTKDPEPWTKTVDAISFGKHCPQPTRNPRDPFSNINDTSEDCLFLNVYTPENESSHGVGYSVMIWIHGGAYVFGSAGDSRFDGGVLASEENVIVVACNYRVGALGLLSAGTKDLKGNYGMLDQVHAVKWVHDNIARCVLIMGNTRTSLYNTTLHYNGLHQTTLHHYTTLHYTTLHYTTLHYTTLHYTALHYTTLHYTTLHYTTPYS